MLAEGIALVFATRDVGSGLARFPQLRVEPLGRRDARALLETVLAARLDESVLERIIAETGGDPPPVPVVPPRRAPPPLAGGCCPPAAPPPLAPVGPSVSPRAAGAPSRPPR